MRQRETKNKELSVHTVSKSTAKGRHEILLEGSLNLESRAVLTSMANQRDPILKEIVAEFK